MSIVNFDTTNLLNETEQALIEYGQSAADVLFIMTGNHVGSWADFAAIADFEYDAGFGSAVIASDLVIVGSGWWLERHEYDGSEWWEYRTSPKKPERPDPLDQKGLLFNPGKFDD